LQTAEEKEFVFNDWTANCESAFIAVGFRFFNSGFLKEKLV